MIEDLPQARRAEGLTSPGPGSRPGRRSRKGPTEVSRPSLTSISIPWSKAGSLSVELLGAILGGNRPAPRKHLLPAQLVVRAVGYRGVPTILPEAAAPGGGAREGAADG